MSIEWLYGPHGSYILAAYAASIVIAVYCAVAPIVRRRALLQRIRQARRSERLAAAEPGEQVS